MKKIHFFSDFGVEVEKMPIATNFAHSRKKAILRIAIATEMKQS